MDVRQIAAILNDCKGEVINGKPAPDTKIVNVWFKIALKPDKVREHEEEMIVLLRDWPYVAWEQQIPRLGEEISYAQVGAALDNQDYGKQLLAFGKLLGWWEIKDPYSMFGLTEDHPVAQELVGYGGVSIIGYKPEGISASDEHT